MDAYRTVLVEDPLQERIHLAVMRLYAAQGRRDLVRRQYDNLCRAPPRRAGRRAHAPDDDGLSPLDGLGG